MSADGAARRPADPASEPAPISAGEATRRARLLETSVGKAIRGKDAAVRLAVACFVARGHLLIEDVPGTGKTTLARALARSLDARFRRIQLTPDLLPSDVTGVSVLDPRTQRFELREGPVFTDILLADEINRATPRTQAALLEALEERQVTIDGETRQLGALFFCVATLNPVEQQGTFPLPEAELDRFLLRVTLGYPSATAEAALLAMHRLAGALDGVAPVLDREQAIEMQQAARHVHVDETIARYVVDIARATRTHPDALLGVSPRASIALMRAAQAMAVLEGEEHVEPEHVKALAPAVLTHRVLVRPQARLKGVRAEDLIASALRATPVPVAIPASKAG